ncbi:IPT/TIG domain-containing protein [Streptomyces mirabilis]|uniref:IPT/TIG domain-containing protein n=1 Tax=Streptomyces mirabilis TaxID=68239 RepID=UPI002F9138C0
MPENGPTASATGPGEDRPSAEEQETRSFWKTQGLLGFVSAVLAIVGTIVGVLITNGDGSQSPSESPPTTAIPTSSGRGTTSGSKWAQASITLSPSSGPAGKKFFVTGTGFTGSASDPQVVWFNDDTLEFVHVNNQGEFHVLLQASPNAQPGDYLVTVTDTSHNVLATATFRVA